MPGAGGLSLQRGAAREAGGLLLLFLIRNSTGTHRRCWRDGSEVMHTLVENAGSIPSTLQRSMASVPGNLTPSSGFIKHYMHMAHKFMQANIYIHYKQWGRGNRGELEATHSYTSTSGRWLPLQPSGRDSHALSYLSSEASCARTQPTFWILFCKFEAGDTMSNAEKWFIKSISNTK